MKTFEEKWTAWLDGKLSGKELVDFEASLPDKTAAEAEKHGAHKLGALLKQELGAQATLPRFGKVHHLLAGAGQVRSQIEQELRRVGVAVDDEQGSGEDEQVHSCILRPDRVTSAAAPT